MINCTKCGKELPDSAKFCKFCGSEAISSANVQQPENEPPKKSSKKLVIAIIAVFLVALIVLGIIFIPDLLKKDKSEPESASSQQASTTVTPEKVTKPQGQTDNPQNDKDIFMSLDGKYYVPVKITYCYDDMIDSEEIIIWNAGSLSISSKYGDSVINFEDGDVVSKAVDINSPGDFEYSHTDNFEYIYNAGLLTQIKRTGGSASVSDFEYDDNGNLIKKVYTVIDSNDGYTQDCNFNYDSEGRLSQLALSDDDRAVFEYTSDSAFGFSGFGINGTVNYNEHGKVKNAVLNSDFSSNIDFTYDENGNLVGILSAHEDYSYSIQIEWAEGTREQAVYAENIMDEVVSFDGQNFICYYYPDNDSLVQYFIF